MPRGRGAAAFALIFTPQEVVVTHTPGVLNDDVADLAMTLILAWARQVARADRFVRAGQWPTGPLPLGRKVSGARLGIVGMGRIGQAIAQRAAAFGVSTTFVDPLDAAIFRMCHIARVQQTNWTNLNFLHGMREAFLLNESLS